jgi:K+-sensing histidine kinase KdpD
MQYPHRVTSNQVNDILKQVLSICQSPLKNVVVTTDLAAELPSLELDPELMQQALVSLILNMVDALNSQKSPTINISTKLIDNKIQITLDDSGEKLTEGEINSMFQSILNFDVPYQTINQKRLNIAMAREILAKYRSKISAENRAEGGVRFIIELPLQNSK